jgi:hypothetical protein
MQATDTSATGLGMGDACHLPLALQGCCERGNSREEVQEEACRSTACEEITTFVPASSCPGYCDTLVRDDG